MPTVGGPVWGAPEANLPAPPQLTEDWGAAPPGRSVAGPPPSVKAGDRWSPWCESPSAPGQLRGQSVSVTETRDRIEQ